MSFSNLIQIAPLFDKDRTYALRGISMIMIVIHHIFAEYTRNGHSDMPKFLYVINTWGYIGTGIFFLISGFAIYCTLNKLSSNYFLESWKRLRKLLLTFLFAIALYVLFYSIYDYTVLSVSLLWDVVTLSLPNSTTCFFKVIIALYLFSFIIWSFSIKQSVKMFLVLLICGVYLTLGIIFLPEFYWTTVLCFPLGMYLAGYKNLLFPYFEKHKKECSFIALLVMSLFIVMEPVSPYNVTGNWGRIILSIIFSLFSIVFVYFINPCCVIFNYIGRRSLDFYLFQIVFLQIGLVLFQNWFFYSLFVITAVTLVSLFYSNVEKRIFKK